ncbi:bifunctional adenosylcobinamide kinase/adenosylcobinamide-phosphate guanylyltransferase [uncultured Dialister sp.]|jgi:adenosylcobinamide kinase/adenosylcobinamide-phosphate guanylyltransferase|uniref:bifunctional adenosylcobinamide kinase/adenosylcobinamide-phosphate guanylyltransferase n=1 Tax=Dialister sp. TaxID=1955814 RepID=UPI0025FB0D42|nr:bifunctional adenosylcobinamide kinase/adenosylcobinamide-phosphate guanylyltransferase [uncultured Dialister sp.]
MKNKIFLVLGGARSGKSEFAEKLMYHSTGKRKGYIATSQILDDEMRYRVILHRQRRPADWKTFEVMHGAGEAMEGVLSEADAILFDCITMYVNNILMDHMKGITVETLGVSDLTTLQTSLERDLDLMFDKISRASGKEIIFVSDELGMGIVPANAMSRVYRDLVGLANQYVAKRADKVYLSIAGITMELKERGVEL